ncbi:hypothetical protein DFH06DRAFT_516787 [Mycena polygramma]|nr:hypothetical protein DFH06DRAFT_516787 [Mycena polygramma]
MPAIRNTPISIVASALANNIPIKALAAMTIFVVIALAIRSASPARLTDILADTMCRVKASCAEAVDAGYLSSSEIKKLRSLQRQVAAIDLATLQNSRSHWKELCGFLKGRTFTLLLCIREAS